MFFGQVDQTEPVIYPHNTIGQPIFGVQPGKVRKMKHPILAMMVTRLGSCKSFRCLFDNSSCGRCKALFNMFECCIGTASPVAPNSLYKERLLNQTTEDGVSGLTRFHPSFCGLLLREGPAHVAHRHWARQEKNIDKVQKHRTVGN